MRPERPECQCLACAQLQHHQANDTLLLVAIGTVVVVGGLVWLVGQVAGLLASGTWPEVPLVGAARHPRPPARPCGRSGGGVAGRRARAAARPGRHVRHPGRHPRHPGGPWGAGVVAAPATRPAQAASHPRPPAAGGRCRRPSTRTCRCCRRPSTTGRRRDRDHPACPADRARRPREQWRGRAGTGRHQPRGGPPLRSDPPASPLVYPLAYPPA